MERVKATNPKLSPGEADAAPVIVIAGKEWPVPLFAPRQNRLIVPSLTEMMPTLARILSALELKDSQAITQIGISTAEYDRFLEVAHMALTRACPELSKDDFLDMAVETGELLMAIPVIMQQTGMFKKAAPGELKPGEV